MMGSWDSGIRRSRMTQDESRGKAYIKDDGKLGLGCIDLGWTVSGYIEDRCLEAGTWCIDLG